MLLLNLAALLEKDFDLLSFNLNDSDLDNDKWQEFQERLQIPLTAPKETPSAETTARNASTEGDQGGLRKVLHPAYKEILMGGPAPNIWRALMRGPAPNT
ncbi:hypothetical protein GOBAR_DD34653 [Gossypium barbadense]|nr:hypothetical protein GOBAR_DD34653 [Gossypium barbadense]